MKLNKILKQAEAFETLTKVAEEMSPVANDDLDNYAEEYTKKLFMKLWDKAEIKLED